MNQYDILYCIISCYRTGLQLLYCSPLSNLHCSLIFRGMWWTPGLTESLAVGGPKMDGSVKIAWLIGYSWEFYYVLLPKLLGIVRNSEGKPEKPN